MTDKPVTGFGTELRRLRLDRGMTGAQLAPLMAIGEPMLSMLETGHRNPNRRLVQRAIDAMDLNTVEEARLYLAAELLPPGRWQIDITGRVRQAS